MFTYADIILPVFFGNTYTYKVPQEWQNTNLIGIRVLVQFGAKKVYTGIVKNMHNNAPEAYSTKDIIEVLDVFPFVNNLQLEFIERISTYYICNQGDVLNITLPSGFKLSSESIIQINPSFTEDLNIELNEIESQVIDELRLKEHILISDLQKLINQKSTHKLITSLIDKRAILLLEHVKDKYTPLVVKKIKLNDEFCSNDALSGLMNSLTKTPLQLDVFMKYLHIERQNTKQANTFKGISKKELENVSPSSLKTLIKNKVFIEIEEVISRVAVSDDYRPEFYPTLSPIQTDALQSINNQLLQKDALLFHGITGSGKTEIYISLIKQTLEAGNQALLLLPEIALTTQIVNRLTPYFGNSMAIYHSKFSDHERAEVYEGVLKGKFNFVVGVRSSIFLPFENLGLIIIDEEHESSYKQNDPSPRYHARETALMLAQIHKAKVVLGSATPSIESYYLATVAKRWGYVLLNQRFGNAELPEIFTINTAEETRNKTMKGEFASVVLEKLQAVKDAKQQSILFQNRRGYSPCIQCDDCQWIPYCKSCDVRLTYHLGAQEMRCHYCGYHEKVSKNCQTCGSPRLRTIGTGTQKVEDELSIHLPDLRLKRMDLDTTRSKNAYQQIIQAFEDQEIDVLIGTQMITKGLDFENVSYVLVIDADHLLHFPDFRAQERTFQLITQVSGRAGRGNEKGLVHIQTKEPQRQIFKHIINYDYTTFFEEEIKERELFSYPPFVRLIKITFKANSRETSIKVANLFKEALSSSLGNRVLGPEAPGIERVRDMYLQNLMIKLDRTGMNIAAIKEHIRTANIKVNQIYPRVQIHIDVDPA